jgi:hypothetical protein
VTAAAAAAMAAAAAAMAMAVAAMAMAVAAMAMAVAVMVLMAAAGMAVEVERLMGATSLTEGWAVLRKKRARMQQRAARSSRR